MQTNKTISPDSELGVKAKALFQAAYDYWEAYQKELGPSAVVWVESESGHFILFTRSEYKEAIMSSANRETQSAQAMFEPFSRGEVKNWALQLRDSL